MTNDETEYRISGKGIAVFHMMRHVNPLAEPYNTICEAIGKDIDAKDAEIERLRKALSFYAEQEHIIKGARSWDLERGLVYDRFEEVDVTVESGTTARRALAALDAAKEAER